MLKIESVAPDAQDVMFEVTSNIQRLAELEEAVGILHQVTESEGFAIAVFAWGAISLPGEMSTRLRELINRKIAVLRLDGYHLRDLEAEDHA
jgi:hypothetical protein